MLLSAISGHSYITPTGRHLDGGDEGEVRAEGRGQRGMAWVGGMNKGGCLELVKMVESVKVMGRMRATSVGRE